MASTEAEVPVTPLAITPEERQLLRSLLVEALGDTRVEVHHTHTPDYRESLRAHESLIRQLIEKLREVSD